MKVAILAGGFGTRISEYTKTIPKPMVKIGKFPILTHIINLYLKFGYKDFYILCGYKSNVIKKYFKNVWTYITVLTTVFMSLKINFYSVLEDNK